MMIPKESKILIVGAGRIGKALHLLLSERGSNPTLLDKVSEVGQIEKHTGCNLRFTDVFATVPYFAVQEVAKFAARMSANFYDFTENVLVKQAVKEAYIDSVTSDSMPCTIVSGCGVAPGLCNIVAGGLMDEVEFIHSVHVYVGGVPVNRTINPLHYYNIWSLDGLHGLYFGEEVRYKQHDEVKVGKLGDGYRRIIVLGKEYEAFYTGGTTVSDLFEKGIPNVSYSTVRHVGHLDKIFTLNNMLNFKDNPEVFKNIIAALPKDNLDETVLSVEVSGESKDGTKILLTDDRIFSPYKELSSMQYATALGGVIALCNVWHYKLTGSIDQEDLDISCL